MDILVTSHRDELKRCKPYKESKLGFGCYFSNHIFLMDYREGLRLLNPRIVPCSILPMEAFVAVSH